MKKFFSGIVFMFLLVAVLVSLGGVNSDDPNYHLSNPIISTIEKRRLHHVFHWYVNQNMPLSYLSGSLREQRVEELTQALVDVQMNGYGYGYYGCWVGGEICARTQFVNVRGNDIYKLYDDIKSGKLRDRNITEEEQAEIKNLADLVIYKTDIVDDIAAAILG